ncbi:ankyrin repeat-containing domain protein [Pavlovales sp. CCMP2436]|nr:ankyrin repeat-containing domain protein [Pavlovales sp. CCMP2436]|mmetsp:Transcript_6592/g.17148  ORF Transcript_6592/g.17148 Transcript_6592/m.17148 type:complete len:205 (+) Transcript_6592:90-704(+)
MALKPVSAVSEVPLPPQDDAASPPADARAQSMEDFAYRGNLAEVKRMLERGADPNMADGVEGGYNWSAVNSAAAAGHKNVVQHLVRKRADLNAANANGHTPLHSAAARGHIHVVRYLCDIDEEFWKRTEEFGHWERQEGRDKKFEEGGFWIATTAYLARTSTGGKTAAQLALELDHDFVSEYLEHRKEELDIVEKRRGGTNRPS